MNDRYIKCQISVLLMYHNVWPPSTSQFSCAHHLLYRHRGCPLYLTKVQIASYVNYTIINSGQRFEAIPVYTGREILIRR